jgi:hypothetical protein
MTRDNIRLRSHGALTASALALLFAMPSQAANHDILILSNRADLISGGDALVELVAPFGIKRAIAVGGNVRIEADLDGVPLPKSTFALRPDGRLYGLVTGLKVGPNVLTARFPGRSMQITITNYPIGGPVFSGGGQLEPWICATKTPTQKTISAPDDPSLVGTVTTRASGLSSDPTDSKCNTPTDYLYYYQPQSKVGTGCTLGITGANPCFIAYDPAARPADSLIADFTNDRGDTVKSMLRLEKGTINRVIYQVLAYFDPAKPWAPWDPQKGWNRKLHWKMGAATSANHFEAPPSASIFDANALAAGFMVANSSSTEHSQNNNELTAAETLMMVKEHIIETYGEIRYTMADGGSGGSMMQTVPSSIMPGLLQGLQLGISYPDAVTTWIETLDCGLLGRFYSTPRGSAFDDGARAAINGHPTTYCNTWINSFLNPQDPVRAGNCGAGFPASIVYDPVLRPKGVRCSIHDIQVAQWGTFVDTDGNVKTKLPYDNVGVQYGLKGLQDGAISVEQFVQLNEGIGSFSNDLVWSGGTAGNPVVPAARHAGQADVIPTLHKSGMVTDAKQLATVAMIDLRPERGADIHMTWRSFQARARLDAANGGHENHVIRASLTSTGQALARQSFKMMDRWLAAVEADRSELSLPQKIIVNRPADVKDGCFTNNVSTDADLAVELPLTDPACPLRPTLSPHRVAGGPLTENIFKCQLKPFNPADPDYKGASFTAEQVQRLALMYPQGVCDWTKPGVGVADAVLTTFTAGPGGQPMPPPPVAR